MTLDVSRNDYLWLLQSQAGPLLEATRSNDEQHFLQQFGTIENAIAGANAVASQWGTPEAIFAELSRAGIVGVGDLSIAFTRAVTARQPSPAGSVRAAAEGGGVSELVDAIATGVKSLGSLTTAIIGLMHAAWRITSLDVSVRGFILNLSTSPLTYVLDGSGKNPYFENCRSASGPLGTVLPGRQKIADPNTHELVDCVAISPWAISNDKDHTGAFAGVLADMGASDADGNRYVGMGWGVPYSQGTRRSTILATELTDAETFFNSWNNSAPPPEHASSVGFANIFTQKDSLNTSVGRFVIAYQPS